MSCLVVGCGYLGRRVARLLIERGETVFGTTRSRAAELTALGIRPVVAEVLSPESLKSLPDVDRVLYCVGFDRASGDSRRSVYVDGLRNVLDRLKGAPKFVLASTTSVYGGTDGLMDEESPTQPDSDAGRVCLEAEGVVKEWQAAPGEGPQPPRNVGHPEARSLIIRFSGLYGPGRVIRREAILRGDPVPAHPESFINLIHIDDAAQAAVCALDRGVSGRVYLATDDRPVSRGELYRLTARLVGAPEPVFVPPEVREGPGRRFANRRIKEELGLVLRYPDITTGMPAAIVDQSAGAGSM
jgi:nucleoside-diphosphate-sugar epimerase